MLRIMETGMHQCIQGACILEQVGTSSRWWQSSQLAAQPNTYRGTWESRKFPRVADCWTHRYGFVVHDKNLNVAVSLFIYPVKSCNFKKYLPGEK